MDIGIVGLGNAGKPIAERLLAKGQRVKVYDVNPAPMDELARRNAIPTRSAGDAVGDITLVVLPSSVEVKAAAFGTAGLLAALRPESVLVDLSGTDPNFTRQLETECSRRKVDFLGGALHAAGAPAVTIPGGQLSIVIGGQKKALDKCLGILQDICQKVICVPESWMPKAMKIAVIMFAATNSIICAEVFSWLSAQGIDPKLFHRLLQTTGSRQSAARVEEFMWRGNSNGGALSNSYKDIRQALETAATIELPLPLMSAVNQLQEMARAQGLTRFNTPAAVGRLYEILTGIDLSAAVLQSQRVFPEPHEPQVIVLAEPNP